MTPGNSNRVEDLDEWHYDARNVVGIVTDSRAPACLEF